MCVRERESRDFCENFETDDCCCCGGCCGNSEKKNNENQENMENLTADLRNPTIIDQPKTGSLQPTNLSSLTKLNEISENNSKYD